MNRALGIDEGNWLAGFIEGEAHFAITEANGGQSFRCFMSLNVRDDDLALLEWVHDRTGLGALRSVPARRTSKPQVQWLVQTQEDCRQLAELLTEYEPRGRKRAEFEIWRAAVELWRSDLTNRVAAGRRLARRILDARRFRAPDGSERVAIPADDALSGYVHGLLCAEGSFSLAPSKTGLTVHMRRDEKPLLEMLCRALGIGRIRDYPAYGSAQPSTSWHVGRLDDVIELARFLDPQRLRGRKARELELWRRAVAERSEARAAGRPAGLESLVAQFSEVRSIDPAARRRRGTAMRRRATRRSRSCRTGPRQLSDG